MRCLRSAVSVAFLCLSSVATVSAEGSDGLRVATFCCDITPPLGQPMFSGDVIRAVEQPLLAKGIVLEDGGQRYVLCALDWCVVCNSSYDALRNKIAVAAGANPAHVAVQCVHQHTAPWIDRDAQRLLPEVNGRKMHLDPQVLDAIEERLVAAVKQSSQRFQAFDHIGTGQAKVDRVASTRRPVDATGKIAVRGSSCKIPAIRALAEGMIDPYLKTITLAVGEKPLVRLHYYATHPQTAYGDGIASSDMVGDAREELERKEGVFQIYFNGCGGDITAGKYNDRSRKCRVELAERLLVGMKASVAATKLVPAGAIHWRTCSLMLPRRSDPPFTIEDCLARIKDPKTSVIYRFDAAIRMGFLQRSQQPIELSSLEMGNIHIVHLPGEPMICFQLFAQGVKPADFVAVAGYGDAGSGYICPEKAFGEGGYEPSHSWVKPEAEAVLKKAIAALLGAE